MTTLPTESQEHNLYLRIQNSTMREALQDTAQRLGFVYMGAQGFAGACHRAAVRMAHIHVGEMADALRAAGVAESIIESAVYDRVRASDVQEVPPLARAFESKVIIARGEMVVVSSDFGTHRFHAPPEVVAAWAPKIGQRALLEWALVPLDADAPVSEPVSPESDGAPAGEGVAAGVLHPSQRGGL